MREDRIRLSSIFLTAMLVLTLTTCIDPIAFEAEDESRKLVIFGTFTQLSQEHEVSIWRTGKFGSLGTWVQGATVQVMDEEGNNAQYIDDGEGTYILPEGALCGEVGKAYQLIVTLPNQGRYESTWEIMPEPVEIENIYYEIDYRQQLSSSNILIEQFFVDVYINTPLWTQSGDKVFLRWEIEETWSLTDKYCGAFDNVEACYFQVKNEFEKLKLFAGFDNSQEKLENYRVHSRVLAPYIEFNELHYFNVFQYSLSESTYEYWNKIDIVSNPTGSIFDKIPAGVPGNINEIGSNSEVLGYFNVAAVTIVRVVTTREQISEKIQIPRQCSPFISHFRQPLYCCYCDILPNRIPKPDYWGQR